MAGPANVAKILRKCCRNFATVSIIQSMAKNFAIHFFKTTSTSLMFGAVSGHSKKPVGPRKYWRINSKCCQNIAKTLPWCWTSHGKTLLYYSRILSVTFFQMPFSCDEPTLTRIKTWKWTHIVQHLCPKMALQVNFTTTFEILMTLRPSLAFPQVSKPTGHDCLCLFQYREPAHPEYQSISPSFSAAVVTRWDVST